jgi:mannosyl-3-phosphoglycerate phosphatase
LRRPESAGHNLEVTASWEQQRYGGCKLVGRCNCRIFSDLDGTFLDERTYGFDVSLPTLQAARARGIQVVFCSSKTCAEIRNLLADLHLSLPFIAENGGGIFMPEGCFDSASDAAFGSGPWRVIALGTRYESLIAALAEVRSVLGIRLRGFSDMSAQEISRVCGLDLSRAMLAKQRMFDEPLLIEQEDPALLERLRLEFERRGLKVTRGGRFLHLTGSNDKGAAVRRFNELAGIEPRSLLTVGIGDSANDLPMLAAVDVPALVQRPDGRYDELVVKELPDALLAPGIGPEGWVAVVRQVLSGKLPGRSPSAQEGGRKP